MLTFDLVDLKLFLAIEQTASFSRGAAAIPLAVSSASTRISNLEAKLSTKLFYRESSGVFTTPAGALFSSYAKDVLVRTEKLKGDIFPFQKEGSKAIRVASNRNAINSFLPVDLGRFSSKYPEIQLKVRAHYHNWELLNSVACGDDDLGVTAYKGEHPGLEFTHYHSDRLCAIFNPLDPDSKKESYSFKELLEKDFIAIGPNSALQELVDEKARDCGRSLSVRAKVSSYLAALSMVREGAGIAIMPFGMSLSASDLVFVPIMDDWADRTLRICYRKETRAKNLDLDTLIKALEGSELKYIKSEVA